MWFLSAENLASGFVCLLVQLGPDVPAVLAPVGILEVLDFDCNWDVLLNLKWRDSGPEKHGRDWMCRAFCSSLRVQELLAHQTDFKLLPARRTVPEERGDFAQWNSAGVTFYLRLSQ